MNSPQARTSASERGVALLGAIAVIVILGLITLAFVAQMTAHRQTASTPVRSLKAFYISEGALEIGKKYIFDQQGVSPAWAPVTDLFVDEPLGEGTFSLNIYWEDSSTFASFTASAALSTGGEE